jgi:predicted transcriptional regulator
MRKTDGTKIRRFRRKFGLTQDDLAQKVGYSIRLIRKAEAGASIAPETAMRSSDVLSRSSSGGGNRIVIARHALHRQANHGFIP